MNIIKIVVDELPKSCNTCELLQYNDFADAYCAADAFKNIHGDWDLDKRPDACPLEVDSGYWLRDDEKKP